MGTYRSSVICNKSFRTTIPKPVAKALKLEHKDKIAWELIVKNGEVLAVVMKFTGEGDK
jgi:bifunctional DNA-binding transcriptional regulator/antitoxin component of YhaV-PrlF toxin-antitoxin module